MQHDSQVIPAVALAGMVLVASACTSVGDSRGASTTLNQVQHPTSTRPPERSQVTTEEGFLLPPGYDADDLTTTPPSFTVFDDRTTCDGSAEDLDVLRMQALVVAYNTRDTEALLRMMGDVHDIYDATAVPHLGAAAVEDPLTWAQAGWEVNDQLRLVLVRTYSGSGADGRIERRNDLLEQAGIGWLTYSFKVQASGCTITRFVAHGPLGDECQWYTEFSDQLRAAEIPVPQICRPIVLHLGEGDVLESFDFEAPDPRTHHFDVEITMPIATELELTLLTTDGATLRILDPDRTASFCEEEGGELRCLLHLPILEARQPGTWVAQVRKLSLEPAEVRIRSTWRELGPDT